MSTIEILPEQRPLYISGNWYASIRGAKAAGSIIAANNLRLLPFFIARPITISDLHCRVTTAVTGGNAQLAIYANNPVTNKPTGPALGSTASISTTGVGNKEAAITGGAITLNRGWYWGAIMVDSTAAPTAVFQTITNDESHASFYLGSPNSISISGGGTLSALVLSFANPGSYGSWPNLTGVTFTELNTSGSASIGFKISAIP